MIAQPETLESCLEDCTILPCTPSILRSLSAARTHEKLRAIFLGGEATTQKLISSWTVPGRAIYNCYGPSETTCASLLSELSPGSPIDLGRPMKGSDVSLVTNGVRSDEGEIWISGPGLAIGYLNKPALTASKFVFFEGKRFYRTGDFARRQDGKLYFLGRGDSMIKNRGFLVNLESEVIPALLAQYGVESATALHIDGSLYGFVTPSTCPVKELRRNMLEEHDAFLVPDRIYALNSLVLNQNGKIDGRPLQQMVLHNAHKNGDASVAPGTMLDFLRSSVADVLCLPFDAVNDDATFVSLGGNSLLALRLLTKLREKHLMVYMAPLMGDLPLRSICSGLTSLAKPCIRRLPYGESFPLTTMQEKMLCTMATNPVQYYLLVEIDLAASLSDLQESQFRSAWEMLYRRHVILTCTFDLKEQECVPSEAWEMDWMSVSISKSNRASEIARQKKVLFQRVRSCDASNPLNAFRMITATDSSPHILWCIHHSRIDGHSVAVLLDELRAILDGNVLPNPPEFHAVLCVQRSLRAAASPEAHTFWNSITRLQADAKALQLPRETTPACELGFSSEYQAVITSGIPLTSIASVCRSRGISVSSLIYGAWAKLMMWYTGSKAASFGVVFSGRNLRLNEADVIIGPLINVCPFAMNDMQGDQSAKYWIQDIHSQILAMADYQWTVPMDHTAFDTLVSLQYDMLEARMSSKSIPEPWKIRQTQLSEFTWTLLVESEREELKFRLLFAPTKVTSHTTIKVLRQFRDMFLNLLDALIQEESGRSIRPPLSQCEFDALIQREQPPAFIPPGHSSLKVAFEMVARVYPDAVAVEGSAASLTYEELDAAANKVAWDLSSYADKGTPVAILADGSLDWIIATLAAVKVGAVYCPIDVELPAERAQTIIRTSGAKTALVPRRDSEHLISQLEPVRVIFVSDILSEPGHYEALQTDIALQDPAYLIFTSGTTGTPKGVLATHQGLLSYISYPPARLHAALGRRIAQMFSVGFDACAAEIFGTLCYGATLVLKHPGDILKSLHSVDAAMMTPSLLSACDPSNFANLEAIVLGGEAVPEKLANTWAEGRRLYNGYGPCECTVGSIFRQLSPRLPVTIGRPIPGMRAYITHEGRTLAPVGVTGEICLSGAQVANGYFACEAYDKDRFLPDPWNLGLTMFRTGDFGRWTENMDIEFLGRRDRLVKVRGYRVNLEEIEIVIRQTSADIDQVGVVVKNDGLVAFITPKSVDIDIIRDRIRSRLPIYCVPSRILVQDTIPLTTNQKIDYRELENLSRIQKATTMVLPLGPMRDVAKVWEDILQIPNLSVKADDDFIALGGSSILQLRLIQRLSSLYSCKVPLDFASRNNLLAQQVLAVRDLEPRYNSKKRGESFLEWMRDANVSTAIVSPAEEEIVSLSSNTLFRTAFNMPCLFKVTGKLNVHRLASAIRRCVISARVLRTKYIFDGDRLRRGFQDSLFCSVRVGHIGESVSVDDVLNQPFDFSKDPLLKAVLYGGVDDDVYHLLIVAHHTIMDATSLRTFLGLIQACYAQFDVDRPDEKHDASSRPDYIDLMNWKLAMPLDDSHAVFWREYLASPPSPLLQPRERCRLNNAGGNLTHHIPSDLLHSILVAAAEHNITIHQMLLSALLVSLSRAFHARDIVVCIPYAHRDEPGTESMQGNLLDRIPVRVSVDSVPPRSSRMFLKKVKQSIQGALEHVESFSAILQHIQQPHLPPYYLSEVMFSYHSYPNVPALELPGCTVEYIDGIEARGAKFPVLIEGWATAGHQGLDLRVEYMLHWIEERRVRQILDGLEPVLRGFCE